LTCSRGFDFLTLNQNMHGLAFLAIALGGLGERGPDVAFREILGEGHVRARREVERYQNGEKDERKPADTAFGLAQWLLFDHRAT
jgi:hypothetical protein